MTGFSALTDAEKFRTQHCSMLPPRLKDVYKRQVQVAGMEVKKAGKKKLYREVSAVFQNPGNQFIALNVLDEVFKSLELWNPRENGEALRSRALEILDRYGLKKYRRYSPYMLSQGQQRRLAVLSVLAGGQRLLLLDEPTYGQDCSCLLYTSPGLPPIERHPAPRD